MNVIFTIGLFVALAAWGFAVYSKLLRLRKRVKEAWQYLEGDQANHGATTVYNRCVTQYNDALESFPANFVAMAGGLKPARLFKSELRDQQSEI